jgi:hypothetical protein
MYVDVVLSPLKERFLQEGLRTGFILFLSDYLQHSIDSIVFIYMQKVTPKSYTTTFIVNDVYSMFTKMQVSHLTRDIVQGGLTSTFGVQSNTFSTVTQQRRRRLLQQSAISLNVNHVDAQCISQGACSRFFTMTNPNNPCESTCVSLPCPPGYTGFYGLCEICPNATYKEIEGNESCIACPAGFTSDQGASNMSQCAPPPPTAAPTPLTTVAPANTAGLTAAAFGVSTSNAVTQHTSLYATTGGRNTSSSSTPEPTQTPFFSSRLPDTTARTTSFVSTAATYNNDTTPPPPPPPYGTGGWGQQQQIINNFNYYNLTFLKQIFNTEWNSGKAGTTQYIIINEERDEWALTMVCVLMAAGFLAIAAIGARLFFAIERPSASAPSQTRQKKKEIHIPIIIRPSSSGSDDEDDDEHTRLLPKKYSHRPPPSTFFPSPPGPFLGFAYA